MLHNELKRRNKRILVSVTFLILFLVGCSRQSFVEIGGKRIVVEIADTPVEREQGLMFREKLCDTCGMLFVFEGEGMHSFWMKNVIIPLDIIFIDKNGVIVDVVSAEPCGEEPCKRYTSSKDILHVLEVNKGFASAYYLSRGDHVTFSV